jgi:hypothetical protein
MVQKLRNKTLLLLTRRKQFGQQVSFIVMEVLHSSLAAPPSRTKWQAMLWLFFFKTESGTPPRQTDCPHECARDPHKGHPSFGACVAVLAGIRNTASPPQIMNQMNLIHS